MKANMNRSTVEKCTGRHRHVALQRDLRPWTIKISDMTRAACEFTLNCWPGACCGLLDGAASDAGSLVKCSVTLDPEAPVMSCVTSRNGRWWGGEAGGEGGGGLQGKVDACLQNCDAADSG
jgi:hypothetical protein